MGYEVHGVWGTWAIGHMGNICPYLCTLYPLCTHCPCAPYPCTTLALYPITPYASIAQVPHTPCTPLPLVLELQMCPIAHVPYTPVPHCWCGPLPQSPIDQWATWAKDHGGMGHMGNRAHGQWGHRGQWDTGGMEHMGNEAHR